LSLRWSASFAGLCGAACSTLATWALGAPSLGADAPPGLPGQSAAGEGAPDGRAGDEAAGQAQPSAAVEPPRPLTEALVEYPAGASGAAEVVLELVIAASGELRDAAVVSGTEPFASAALAAARGWRFAPARRGEQPVAARIRFQVLFPEPAPAAAPAASPDPTSTSGVAPTPPPIEVTVTGQRPPPNAQSFTRAEVRQLPGAFGDPFRAIESLPGVTPILSGVPFFYVRGAPPGNVGYYLDGIRLPLLYHVGLGPSVVHPALVSRVDLYPGAYPTRYGRFSGGIVAGEVNEPGQSLWGEWQLRLFDVGAVAETPFAGGRGQVLVGGRYSYTAYLLSLLAEENVRLEYWDYQLRASYRVAPAHTLGVFVFGSFDYFGEDTEATNDELFSTEFHRLDVRHRYAPSPGTQLTSSLTLGLDRTRVAEDTGSALNRRAQLRTEYQRTLSPELELRAGFDGALDRYSIEAQLEDDVVEIEPPTLDPTADPRLPPPTTVSEESEDERRFRLLFPSRLDRVVGAYGELTWRATRGVRLTSGLRSDLYASAGALAVSLEPRLSAEFDVAERLTLKHALGLAAQPPSFVVPVAGFEIGGLPGGLQRSVQSSAGLEYRLPDAMKLSLTLFQNAFFNMTDVLSLARLENEDDLQPDTRTRGQAYGVELLFHRDLTRRLGGFLAYTLSRSVRSSGIGRVPASFDRTHVLNTALAYDLGRNWRLGGHFLLYTGNPSFSSSLGTEQPGPGGRLPAYHRLDLRIEKRWPFGSSGGFAAVVLEWLNATLSKEVISRECTSDGCEDEAIGPVTIPSLAFEGRF
jgi:TonB family protein